MGIPISRRISHEDGVKKRKSTEIKIAQTFALVVGTYVICWAPMTINFFIVAFKGDPELFQKDPILQFYNKISMCAAHFSSAVNPFIYAYRVKDIRDTFKEVLQSCRRENWR